MNDLPPELAAWFNARADAIRDVAAHRASPPEYPGMALVPAAALDRLAQYVETVDRPLRKQLSTVAGYKAWKANPEPVCTECGGGKGLGHTSDCPTVAGDRDMERIEAAICRSEIAGSGHATGDIPCEWHTVAGNVKVARFLAALREGREPK